MRFSLRWVTRNWQLKLAAFTLAILLWVVVSAEQITTQWISGVPVQVDLRDPDYVLTGRPVPREVEVRFAGPGRELWELALDRPVVVLPIGEVEGGEQVFVLDPRMVRVPNGPDAVRALDVRPSSVRIPVERLAAREVPVRLRLAPGFRDRYVLLDTPTVQPGYIRVTGPASRVSRIDALYTEPLVLDGADTAFSRVLRIDSVPRVRLSTGAVRVTGRVDRRVERILPRVPVAPVPGAEATPAQVEVRLQGPARLVRALDPAALRVAPVADSLPPAIPPEGVLVPLSVSGLPPGIGARVTPSRVRVARPGAFVPEAIPEAAVQVPDTLPGVQERVP